MFLLETQQKILWYQECDFWAKLWKCSDDYGFLKNCHSQILQQKLKDLDKAFKEAFDKTQPNKRLPRPKKKGQQDSFRYPQGFKINGNHIFLPKLGWFKFRQSRPLQGQPKNVTVSYYCGHWYVSIQTEYEVAQAQHPSTSMIGVDVGIARFATLSTGQYFKAKNSFRRCEAQLARAQRSLSRKVKLSNNWKKQKQKIQKLHAKIARTRQDYLHWCSSHLSKNHAMIVMEDLKINAMSRSAKGDLENPGRKVSAKSGLNKSILDQGWGEFKRQLSYKSAWLGGEVLLVNPRYTSQTCPDCGHCAKANRQTQAHFACVSCGYTDHADVVGAINVLRAGHAQLAGNGQLACGDIGSVSFQAQEPLKDAA